MFTCTSSSASGAQLTEVAQWQEWWWWARSPGPPWSSSFWLDFDLVRRFLSNLDNGREDTEVQSYLWTQAKFELKSMFLDFHFHKEMKWPFNGQVHTFPRSQSGGESMTPYPKYMSIQIYIHALYISRFGQWQIFRCWMDKRKKENKIKNLSLSNVHMLATHRADLGQPFVSKICFFCVSAIKSRPTAPKVFSFKPQGNVLWLEIYCTDVFCLFVFRQ